LSRRKTTNWGELHKYGEKMRPSPMENQKIIQEMDNVTKELQERGIDIDTNANEMIGLGDAVEDTLKKFGITQERFKEWFGLRACHCDERKKWLNNLFSWKKET
jgi:hypothetical protein